MNFEISGFVELTGLTCYVINTGLYWGIWDIDWEKEKF